MMTIPASSEVLAQAAFYLFAGLTLFSAFGVVFNRSIVYSALLLLVCFLSIAGIFVTLNAPFLAAAEILVYAVGLTIVLVFGVMLTGDVAPGAELGATRVSPFMRVFAVIGALILMEFLLIALFNFPQLSLGNQPGSLFNVVQPPLDVIVNLPGAQAILKDGGVTQIGELLFSQYLVAFEVASVLLLLAMIGAILLSKRSYPEEEGDVDALALHLGQTMGSQLTTEDEKSPELVGAST